MPDKGKLSPEEAKTNKEESKATLAKLNEKRKVTPAEAKGNALENKATDPEEERIEKNRLALKIPKPEDYKTAAARQALTRLNTKNLTKYDTAEDAAKRYGAERKAKPFAFKKGGKVQKGGMALVHTGERVLTKAQQKSGGNMKRISCKR